jgi:quercetin dioxygenase-like cupin family protein
VTIAFAATEDVLAPGQRVGLPPAARALYVRSGRVVIAQDGTETTLTDDGGALIVGAATLAGDGMVWGFEATRSLAAPDPLRTVLHVTLPRDPDAPLLLRADRVDFPPGAVTPRHGHAGPGIRRLIAGRLFAEIGTTYRRIDAGEAWFESGEEPVVGRNIAPASAFVRCMVLDPDLLGRPTFRPDSAEDAAKPRAVGYRQFFDTIVTLPH